MSARPAVYPVSLVLLEQPCLVVGGRHVAYSKITGLLEAGANVTVIAPDVIDEVIALPVTIHRREFRAGDSATFVLVIAATGDRGLEAEIFAECQSANTFVNAADNPESCTFYLPALLREGDLSVAMSTAGASPAIASWVRDRVVGALGEHFSDVVEIVGATRDSIRSSGQSSEGLPWADLIDQLTSAISANAELAEIRMLAADWAASVVSEEPAAGPEA